MTSLPDSDKLFLFIQLSTFFLNFFDNVMEVMIFLPTKDRINSKVWGVIIHMLNPKGLADIALIRIWDLTRRFSKQIDEILNAPQA